MLCCSSWLLWVIVTLAILKIYLKLKVGWNRSPVCLMGKTAIVTGANTGIGFYTAQDLAQRGAKVILACRDKNRAEKARTTIIENTGNENVLVKLVDLTSISSVREFAAEIKATEEQIDILINNAGVGFAHEKKTADGFDLLFQVNYFSIVLLTLLLLDVLKKSKSARIVNVSSLTHKWANLDVSKLGQLPANNAVHYSNSKLALVLFTNELALKLKNTSVTANSLHPGTVYTELFRSLPEILKPVFNLMAKYFFMTPLEGAQTSIYAALSKDLDLISGEYLDNCAIGSKSNCAKDEYLAKKVWEKTEELLKLSSEERL